MLLPLIFAAAPQAFVDIVDHRIAGTKLHLVDWWADDLDGDNVPEAIAAVCDDSTGFYVVQHGKDVLEAPMEIDGRNHCFEVEHKPDWHVMKRGTITQAINVHHGQVTHSFAIRDDRLVLVREDSHAFELSRDGEQTDDETTDYDKLRWTTRSVPGGTSRGPLVLAAEHVHRSTRIVGKTTIAATRSEDHVTLHIHADRALTVRINCNSDPCATTRLVKGDHELPIETVEFDVLAGRSTVHVQVETLETDQSYPPPPTPW